MSKAEERAQYLGYGTDPFNRAEYTANEVREAFIDGYNQAEKDLALTWDDMMVIHKCIKDAMNSHLYEWSTDEGQQRIYQNVLDRFNKERNRKTI